MARRSRRAPCRLAMNCEYTPGGGAEGEDTHVATAIPLVESPENRRILKERSACVSRNPFNSPYESRGVTGLGRPSSTDSGDP